MEENEKKGSFDTLYDSNILLRKNIKKKKKQLNWYFYKKRNLSLYISCLLLTIYIYI